SREAFLLESVEGGERIGRYSFLGMDPFARLTAAGDHIAWESLRGAAAPDLKGGPHPKGGRYLTGGAGAKAGFFDAMRAAMALHRGVPVPGLPPFAGGAVGYIGYDAIRYLERIPD